MYPATRYHAPEVTDTSTDETRERLSPSAMKAFFRIIDIWHISAPDAMRLLGGVSNGSYYALRKNPNRTLDVDAFVRVSYVVGIYKALHLIHSDTLADRWIKLPNKNMIFKGAAPLDYMIRGGIPAFQTVRRLLDARRGGV